MRRIAGRGIGGRRVSGGGGGAAPWTPAALGARVLMWTEARNAGNTVTSTEYETQIDLGPAGNPLGTASATVRPAQATSQFLTDGQYAEYDAVDEWMRDTSMARPRASFVLYQEPNTPTPGRPITSWNTTNECRLRQGTVSTRIGYVTAGTTEILSAANVGDRYWHLIAGIDVDGSANQRVIVWGPDCATEASDDSGANAGTRTAGNGVSSVGAFTTGTFPALMNEAFVLHMSDVPTEDEIALIADYVRREIVDVQPMPVTGFVGTRTTLADAQPRPYPTAHEGFSGNTVSACAARMCGTWGNSTDYAIGSAGDPGAGNRGALETLATTQGRTNLRMLLQVGTNDASSSTINVAFYEVMIRRMFAVCGVTPASDLKVYVAFLTPRTDGGGTPQTRIDQFNDTDMPAMISTLQGASYQVLTWDPETGFVTGTMLRADNLHYNVLGSQHVAAAAYTALTGAGDVGASVNLVLCGDSLTEGGTNLTPQATAQYRPWLAKSLAAGGY